MGAWACCGEICSRIVDDKGIPAIRNQYTLQEMGGIKLDVSDLAKPYREQIRQSVCRLKEKNIESPLLVGLLSNSDPAAKQYAEWTKRACEADGIRYELRQVDDPLDVEVTLQNLNDDPNVHGILVYYPIFGQEESFAGSSQDDYIRDSISYKCDVEGLCHLYRTNLYRNVRYLDYPHNTKKCLLPCTPLAVVKILESLPQCYDKKRPIGRYMEGKVVTIINRSEVVGRPLAAMLANDGSDVYSVDVNSIYLFRAKDKRLHKVPNDGETVETCVRKSSIIILGVPVKSYQLPTEWVQPNSVVVNVASFRNVDEEKLLKIEGVTYVPMVGKVTVAMLERNLIRLFENFHHPDRRIRQLNEEEEYRNRKSNAEELDRGGDEIPIRNKEPWYGNPIQLYTAFVATALLIVVSSRHSR